MEAVVGALMVNTITTTGSKASAPEPIDRGTMVAATLVSIDRPGKVMVTSITVANLVIVEAAPASGVIEAVTVVVTSEGAVAATLGHLEEVVVAWAAEVARPS